MINVQRKVDEKVIEPDNIVIGNVIKIVPSELLLVLSVEVLGDNARLQVLNLSIENKPLIVLRVSSPVVLEAESVIISY